MVMFTKFGKFPQGRSDVSALLTTLRSCLHVIVVWGFFIFFDSSSSHKEMFLHDSKPSTTPRLWKWKSTQIFLRFLFSFLILTINFLCLKYLFFKLFSGFTWRYNIYSKKHLYFYFINYWLFCDLNCNYNFINYP